MEIHNELKVSVFEFLDFYLQYYRAIPMKIAFDPLCGALSEMEEVFNRFTFLIAVL